MGGSSSAPAITGVPTSIAAFIGWAPEGPAGEAVPIESWTAYEATFGGLVAGVWLGYAVYQFFENGGASAYVVSLRDPAAGGGALLPNTVAFEARLCDPATGYAVLDQVPIFNLLCVPGENSAAVVFALQRVCLERRALLLVDCDATATAAGLAASGPADGAGASLYNPYARNSAFYFPWVQAPDPLNGGQPAPFPPCGFVAGVIAATDSAQGVWKAPAGLGAALVSASGLEVRVTDAQSASLAAAGVNSLRQFVQRGVVVWGARTIAGAEAAGSQWAYVPTRRLALFIEASLAAGVQWAIFEPNGPALWAQLQASVETFMHSLFQEGAFAGSAPQQAYAVAVGAVDGANGQAARATVDIVVGFAPLIPAQFVSVQIQQLIGAG